MKKLALITLLAAFSFSVQAGGYRHGGHHRSHHGSSVSFHFGAYPAYSPFYSRPHGHYRAYGYYPSYSYYPSYAYVYSPGHSYDYSYGGRPNYAVRGTLLGALAGGIIGHNVHRQGWEGAGIGAAAGLVLGGLAESRARARESSYYSTPPVSYSSTGYVPEAPVVNDAPTVSTTPRVETTSGYSTRSAMSSANGLFGR
jgi:hypothetical protein